MLNENLRKARLAKSYSQTDIAKHLRITRQAYNNYENGVREPDVNTLVKIASFLSVTVDYLTGHSDNPAQLNASDDDLKVALFGGKDDVTDEMWEEVRQFAEFVKQKEKNK